MLHHRIPALVGLVSHQAEHICIGLSSVIALADWTIPGLTGDAAAVTVTGDVGSTLAASWMHYSGYLQLAGVPYGCRLYILAAGCLIGLTGAVLK